MLASFILFIISAYQMTLTSGWTFPLPLVGKFSPQVQIPTTLTADYDFEGIIGLSNCSGSLIRFADASDDDSALMLTNGHCVGDFIPPNEIIYQEKVSRSAWLYNSAGDSVGQLKADRIIYATMTKSDFALYRLNTSYANIRKKYGVKPYILAGEKSQPGQEIQVISGYWERGYSCAIETFVHQLQEGDWFWDESMRYTRPGCEVIGGTSGSPVVAMGTREVVGINNTGNENGKRCKVNNPCEIDENGDVTYVEGYSYAQQTYWIYSCLDAEKKFDLSLETCILPKGQKGAAHLF